MAEQVHKYRKATEIELSLKKRAEDWGKIGGPARERVLRQADEAYKLYLDFLDYGPLENFPTWLARNSGYGYNSCWKALKAGRARATGSKPHRNQAGLVAEMRERETTPVSELDWDEE